MIQTIATALLVATSLASMPAFAAGFPDKPVTLVVPYPPGGATDTVARIVAKGMTQRLGQTVIIDNRAGAGTAIGAGAVAHAAPDGYTLLISSNTTFTVNPALKSKLPYDAQKSFESIGLIGSSPLVLLAQPSLPAANVRELVALAKAQPGKLSYGSFGNGTTSHFAGEMFKVVTGTDILHVPYKGSAPATTDLLGGQVDAQLTDMTTLAAHVRSGKLKGLAVMGAQRSNLLPEVPTGMESAMPGFQALTWFGIVAPANTPKEIVEKLNKELVRAMAAPDVTEKLAQGGFLAATTTPQEMGALIKSDIDRMGDVVKRANVKVE